jgi:hypothetical protein
MTAKRILLLGLTLLLLIAILLRFAPRSHRRYRADSLVIARPVTNALLARSFETRISRPVPGVLRLEVRPTFSSPLGLPPSSIQAAKPNAVGIRIIAVGPVPENAQRAANDAAALLCRTILTNYGVTGEIVDPAAASRRYSYFHDTLQPALGRLFKH